MQAYFLKFFFLCTCIDRIFDHANCSLNESSFIRNHTLPYYNHFNQYSMGPLWGLFHGYDDYSAYNNTPFYCTLGCSIEISRDIYMCRSAGR